MKNVNFPLDGLPSTEELNNLLQSMIESGGNFVNYMMKIQDDKKLMPDFNGISLDTYGCEHLFVDFFINDEMRKDFPLIAEHAGADECRHDESVLIEEVDKLRRKVHQLESDNSTLRAGLAEKRRLEEEAKDIRKQLEASKRELAVLRNYVYKLTESDNPITDKTIESMKETIAGYRIVIVGGHSNWLSKMKKEFPDWIFINPEASGSTDVSVVDKADYVYFFTDTISHSKYHQFMNVIRERKINFGYIHGVNIEKNIRDIYVDFEED